MKIVQCVAFSFVVCALSLTEASAQTKINNCTIITAPGSYVLSRNITASGTDQVCILIAADFVNLDLAGYTIAGPGSGNVFSDGIAVDACCNRQGIKVHSGIVTNFRNNGVYLPGIGMSVEQVAAIANGNYGIFVGAAGAFDINGHRVVGNRALNNRVGIAVNCPAVVLENVAAGNGTQIQTALFDCTALENSPAP